MRARGPGDFCLYCGGDACDWRSRRGGSWRSGWRGLLATASCARQVGERARGWRKRSWRKHNWHISCWQQQDHRQGQNYCKLLELMNRLSFTLHYEQARISSIPRNESACTYFSWKRLNRPTITILENFGILADQKSHRDMVDLCPLGPNG